MKYKLLSWIIIGVMALIILGLGCYLNKIEESSSNYKQLMVWISVSGSIASIAGIIVTLTQMSSVRKQVKENIDAIKSYHDIVSYTNIIAEVHELINMLPSSEYKYIKRQLLEIKKFLNGIKTKDSIACNSNWIDKITTNVVELGVDIENITKKIGSKSYDLDLDKIIHDLNKVSDLMTEINGNMVNIATNN